MQRWLVVFCISSLHFQRMQKTWGHCRHECFSEMFCKWDGWPVSAAVDFTNFEKVRAFVECCHWM